MEVEGVGWDRTAWRVGGQVGHLKMCRESDGGWASAYTIHHRYYRVVCGCEEGEDVPTMQSSPSPSPAAPISQPAQGRRQSVTQSVHHLDTAPSSYIQAIQYTPDTATSSSTRPAQSYSSARHPERPPSIILGRRLLPSLTLGRRILNLPPPSRRALLLLLLDAEHWGREGKGRG